MQMSMDDFFALRERAMDAQREGDSAKAITLYEAAIKGVNADDIRARQHLADTMSSLAGLHANAQRFDEAEAILVSATELFDSAGSDDEAGYVHDILVEIAVVHGYNDAWEKAEAALERSLGIAQRVQNWQCDPATATERLEHVKARQRLPAIWAM